MTNITTKLNLSALKHTANSLVEESNANLLELTPDEVTKDSWSNTIELKEDSKNDLVSVQSNEPESKESQSKEEVKKWDQLEEEITDAEKLWDINSQSDILPVSSSDEQKSVADNISACTTTETTSEKPSLEDTPNSEATDEVVKKAAADESLSARISLSTIKSLWVKKPEKKLEEKTDLWKDEIDAKVLLSSADQDTNSLAPQEPLKKTLDVNETEEAYIENAQEDKELVKSETIKLESEIQKWIAEVDKSKKDKKNIIVADDIFENYVPSYKWKAGLKQEQKTKQKDKKAKTNMPKKKRNLIIMVSMLSVLWLGGVALASYFMWWEDTKVEAQNTQEPEVDTEITPTPEEVDDSWEINNDDDEDGLNEDDNWEENESSDAEGDDQWKDIEKVNEDASWEESNNIDDDTDELLEENTWNTEKTKDDDSNKKVNDALFDSFNR